MAEWVFILMTLSVFYAAFAMVDDECSSCKSPRHAARAKEYFEQGDLIWEEAEKTDSIPFYRAAVRICPESATYWQTLGRAEQFAGDDVKAEKRFKRAQAILNRQVTDTNEVVVSVDGDYLNSSGTSSDYVAMPTLALEEVTLDRFSFPFVITNAIPQLKPVSDSASSDGYDSNSVDMYNVHQLFEYLESQYDDYPVEFYPQNMLVRPNRMYESSIIEALDYLSFPEGAYVSSDASEAGTYVQWTLPAHVYAEILRASHAMSLQQVFRTDLRSVLGEDEELEEGDVEGFYKATHWYMLLIGETGAGMFNHTDSLPVGSNQLQLTGSKKWTLCIPSPASSSSAASLSCLVHVLQPGEVIYYPPFAHHATECVDGPCSSVSGSVIVDDLALKNYVRNECIDKKRGYQFSSAICRRMRDI